MIIIIELVVLLALLEGVVLVGSSVMIVALVGGELVTTVTLIFSVQ